MGKNGRVRCACLVCAKEFTTQRAWLRNGSGGKFCSRSCQIIGRARRRRTFLSAICQECGEQFSRTKHRAGKMVYCSIQCMSIARGLAMRGSAHPNWKGGVTERDQRWKKLKRAILTERGKCDKCGTVENLQAHHIKNWSDYPGLRYESSNIRVLCADCHAEFHPENIRGMIQRPAQRAGLTKPCVICSKPIYIQPQLLPTKSTCSRKCMGIQRSRRMRDGKTTVDKTSREAARPTPPRP